jgi:hypothetical protein
MHFGALPRDYEPGRSYRNKITGSEAGLSNEPGAMSRRSLLGLAPLALGFIGGAASSVGLFEVLGTSKGSDAPVPTTNSTPVEPGSVEWALWIGEAPEALLLESAGELERVRLRSRGDQRLVPLFARLLKVALASDEPTADQAGAIAVRCLDRLDADHHLLVLGRRVLAREDRPATIAELKEVQRRRRTGRKR